MRVIRTDLLYQHSDEFLNTLRSTAPNSETVNGASIMIEYIKLLDRASVIAEEEKHE